jgi:hypothetical protein
VPTTIFQKKVRTVLEEEEELIVEPEVTNLVVYEKNDAERWKLILSLPAAKALARQLVHETYKLEYPEGEGEKA